jgi:protocadherin alpha
MQDYPSISHLASAVAEQKVNVIFAVTEDQVPVYRKLSHRFEGSTVGQLADDSSNVVQLVKENYNKISRTVELKASGVPGIRVGFAAKCNE